MLDTENFIKRAKKKINKLKIIKMEVISKEEYLKVHYGG